MCDNKIGQILTYRDRWPSDGTMIMGRLATVVAQLPLTSAGPPSFFVVADADYGNVHRCIQELTGCPVALVQVDLGTDAFTEHTRIHPVVVVKSNVWQEFQNTRPNATATIAHELGHVEERLRFGPYPDQAGRGDRWVEYWNYRNVWSEFYAERIAASYYDETRLQRLDAGLEGHINAHSLLGVVDNLGRMIGFASRQGLDPDRLSQVQARHGASYQAAYARLGTLFTDAFQSDALPDLEQIGDALSQLDPRLR